MAKQHQTMHPQSVHDALMADLYFGTPMELDNNSGGYYTTQQNEENINQQTQIQ